MHILTFYGYSPDPDDADLPGDKVWLVSDHEAEYLITDAQRRGDLVRHDPLGEHDGFVIIDENHDVTTLHYLGEGSLDNRPSLFDQDGGVL